MLRYYGFIPVFTFSVSPVREWALPYLLNMSNPFGIPDSTTGDYDYSKLSPMLGMIDNDTPDYIGGATTQRKWNERLTHNCAILYLGGSVLLFSFDW